MEIKEIRKRHNEYMHIHYLSGITVEEVTMISSPICLRFQSGNMFQTNCYVMFLPVFRYNLIETADLVGFQPKHDSFRTILRPKLISLFAFSLLRQNLFTIRLKITQINTFPAGEEHIRKPKSKKPPIQNNFEELEKYLNYLKKKKHVQPNSIVVYEHYGKKILDWAGDRYLYNSGKFKPFFPEYMDSLRKEDGTEYDQDYINGACSFARRFFDYAYKHFEHYADKLPPGFFDDFTPIEKTSRIEKLSHYTEADMIKIASLKPESITDLRNIASFLMIYLSAMRITAFLSLPICDVNLENGIIVQDPSNGTYTKLNKAGETILLNNPIILDVVKNWDALVRKNCPENSTWYARLDSRRQFNPKIIQYRDRQDPRTYNEAHSNYRNFTRAMEELCKRAGITYLSPHKGRYGNIHKWMETVTTMEERQALADNSLHTLAVLEKTYARMSGSESKSVMQRLASQQINVPSSELIFELPDFQQQVQQRELVDLSGLPNYIKNAIITLANNART